MPRSIASEARSIRASTASLRSRDAPLTQSHSLASQGANVKVVVRVRTFLPRETAIDAPCLIEMPDDQTTVINPPTHEHSNSRASQKTKQVFAFDRAFWSHDNQGAKYASQEDVYNELGEEFLDHNFEGFNTCIFAYGQTGAGKSYTMMGGDGAHRGLIPRTCEDMFERISKHKSEEGVTYTVLVSYFEVYNEQIYDLLDTSGRRDPNGHRPALKCKEDTTKGTVVVLNLTKKAVHSYDEILQQMKTGDRNRTTGGTKMNAVSSRSHAVFTIELKSSLVRDDGSTEDIESCIRLVDLAGSEKPKQTGATGKRLKEGGNINKSLATLGRVIQNLAELADSRRKGRGRRVVIPYRESALTFLLRDSLGGNSKTAMVACISPTDYAETLSTLRYASSAKKIQTVAKANHDTRSKEERDAQIAAMTEQIRELQVKVTEGASLRERSVQEHERSIREQTQQLEEYRHQVELIQRAMAEKAAIDETRITKLQMENQALKTHLHLAVQTLQDPITLPPQETVKEEPADEEGEDSGNDEGYFEENNAAFYADDLDDIMTDLISDVSLFRRRIGDDIHRYSVPEGLKPIGASVLSA